MLSEGTSGLWPKGKPWERGLGGVLSTNAHLRWGLLFSFPRALAFGPLLFTFPGSYSQKHQFLGSFHSMVTL